MNSAGATAVVKSAGEAGPREFVMWSDMSESESELAESSDEESSHETGPLWPTSCTSSTAATATVAESVGEDRPPGFAKCSATTESDLVLAERVEQGVVKPGREAIFLPSHTASNPYRGKAFTVEVRHQRVDQTCPGYNAGWNIEGLDKNNMPRSVDVMVCTVSSLNVGKSAGESQPLEITKHGATTESELAVGPDEAGPVAVRSKMARPTPSTVPRQIPNPISQSLLMKSLLMKRNAPDTWAEDKEPETAGPGLHTVGGLKTAGLGPGTELHQRAVRQFV